MQIHKKILGLDLGASLSMMSCFMSTDDDDVNDCEDACNDAHLACVNSCSEGTCPTACDVARDNCIDDCD